jgi:LPXTG-motif cell wall-anchored protein
MIRRTVLMVAALLLASVAFASGAQAGSYTPPSVDPADVQSTGQVSGTGTSTGSGSLPATGSDTTQDLLRVGIVLVAAGGMIAFVARRRTLASRS